MFHVFTQDKILTDRPGELSLERTVRYHFRRGKVQWGSLFIRPGGTGAIHQYLLIGMNQALF